MPKKKNILLKVDTEITRLFKKQADRYTEGNVSRWLRFAGSKIKPTRAELRQLQSK